MRLLLDTHALLWFLLNDPKLSAEANRLIMDLRNEVFVSPASYWEIAIKISRGKYVLDVDEDFGTFMEREIRGNLLNVLPISVPHAGCVAKLPFHHQDPFDRLLIAQSLVEQIPIVSMDSALDAYGVDRRW